MKSALDFLAPDPGSDAGLLCSSRSCDDPMMIMMIMIMIVTIVMIMMIQVPMLGGCDHHDCENCDDLYDEDHHHDEGHSHGEKGGKGLIKPKRPSILYAGDVYNQRKIEREAIMLSKMDL